MEEKERKYHRIWKQKYRESHREKYNQYMREYNKKHGNEYRKTHKKEAADAAKRYAKTHRKEINDYAKKWRKMNKPHINKYEREFYRKKHNKRITELFELLENKCANPYNLIHGDFLNDKRCLQIDHINGGGTKERESFSSYELFLEHVLQEVKKGSKDYQLLCANCNWIKRFENKERKKSIFEIENADKTPEAPI